MATLTTGLTITSSFGSWYFGELPLRADDKTMQQWCIDKGYLTFSGGTYTQDAGRWSNDGGRLMNCYDLTGEGLTGGTMAYHWLNVFGYDPIITSISE